jgi:quaternary ammonium compound-resistance protein SugE
MLTESVIPYSLAGVLIQRWEAYMLQLSVSQAWAVLVLAGILEVIWATGMKATEGFTRLWPSISVTLVALASFYLLGLAMKTLPVGTAYAVWVGIGAAGTALAGMVLYQEPASVMRLMCLLLIVAGVVGLKWWH